MSETTNDPIWFSPPPAPAVVPRHPDPEVRPTVELEVDGEAVAVPQGSTLLEACRSVGKEIPTLCYLETLTPVNACRVCVVEVAGARVLAPACSRQVEAGMKVATASPRVRTARKVVLELLASSVDLDTAPGLAEMMAEYGATPERFAGGATVAQPPKIDNNLYVRDYAKCVLCYKCVEACGEDHQNTFAIAVAGRGFDAHIATEWDAPLPQSACVYCGNCIAVCPTGALMPTTEFDLRQQGAWAPERQTTTDTICAYCGVGCTLSLHVQDERIVKVSSPLDNPTTRGNLCVKGRFGYEFVHAGRDRED
jgi:predicted molibdopterin-dependent oxidoreductase YjgC